VEAIDDWFGIAVSLAGHSQVVKRCCTTQHNYGPAAVNSKTSLH
jgi:hypothetical protein